MIDPLLRFEAEHEEALAVLDRLADAALALRRGEPAWQHLATVRDVHATLTHAVRTHNDKEEHALFPLLGDQAPSAVFIDEHRTLRALEHELAAALDGSDPMRLAHVALSIVELLRAHIERENTVLFPLARTLLGNEGLLEVARRLG
ncbi:MAG: hemerythrin domain-containing protein [Gemmatimonadetes bacterium]|nr:hemerythrin domain-containing protein [Gemmatimonadota bacterium]